MKILADTLKQNKEKYIEKLMDLLSIDTQDIRHGIGGGKEKEGQVYLEELFKEMGASKVVADPMDEAVILESMQKHCEGNPGHNQDDRYNVYATFQGEGKGKSLLFNSHVDVMPADESEGWTNPPFSPVRRDGKIFARGAADMKSGLMASIMAVQLIRDAGQSLPGDVIITSVCDEEGGGNGSIHAVMRGLKADGVINCEGTSDELILAHMGWVFFKVEFEGRSCHSGEKKNGVNAIEKAMKVIQALNEKEHEWLLEYKHPLLPAPNLNIGVIQGGTAGSTVPGDCTFSTCVHFVPGLMSQQQVIDEFLDVVNRTADADLWMKEHRPVVTIYQTGNGFEMDADDPFIKVFQESYTEAKAKDVKIVGSPSGCDSRLWKNIAGCPTLQFGPGNLSECHAVDEWVTEEAYLDSILIYATMIMNWGNQSA